jgi:hypothetical protein
LRDDLEGFIAMTHSLDSLPRRIFLDSCTAQTLGNYGCYIFEGEQLNRRMDVSAFLSARERPLEPPMPSKNTVKLGQDLI